MLALVLGMEVSGFMLLPIAVELKVMTRYGMLLRVRPERFEEYKKYHEAVWPQVLRLIHDCNIRNYSIFTKDYYLFAYFEYAGSDYAADMAKMAADAMMREWWDLMEPMQDPIESRAPGEWWARMEECFHTD